jgi:hypothetical protein
MVGSPGRKDLDRPAMENLESHEELPLGISLFCEEV